ncbi:MAG: LysM peptidoglycan-binding domain-containing protein [Microscillaceae bacterium]|nr:LysM peptidoglycan-binding domain-containing protein [Microscillaceae bacterium]MDW8461066.1 LysM peptidoglycan-binding domain-containing protein [Cytophagales bacterium]
MKKIALIAIWLYNIVVVSLLSTFVAVAKPTITDSLRVEIRAGKQYIVHEVEPDETIYSICSRYNITVQDFNLANPTQKDKKLKIGDIVYIPLAKAQFKLQSSQQGDMKKVHIVQQGEWLSKIARQYNVSPEQLKEWNNLKGDIVLPGQELIVGISNKAGRKPQNAVSSVNTANNNRRNMVAANNRQPVTILKSASPNGMITEKASKDTIKVSPYEGKLIDHIVQEGETLFQIAQKYGVRVSDLNKWNNLNGSVRMGQVLDVYVDEDKYNEILDEREKKKQPSLPNNSTPPAPTNAEGNSKLQTSAVTQPSFVGGLPTNLGSTVVTSNALLAASQPATISGVLTNSGNMPSNSNPLPVVSQSTINELTINPIPKTEDSIIVHIVKEGESIETIRQIYNVSSSEIIRWNKLQYTENGNVKIFPNQKLTIYKPTKVIHKVAQGENIQTLAAKYPTISKLDKKIVIWNRDKLNSANDIKAGQELILFVPHPQGLENLGNTGSISITNPNQITNLPSVLTSANDDKIIIHEVAKGDNLAKISEQYNVARSEIQRWNNLQPNAQGQFILHVGDKLKIYKPTLVKYVVKKGDDSTTLKQAFPTIDKLTRKVVIWNKDKIKSITDIKEGQILDIYVPHPAGTREALGQQNTSMTTNTNLPKIENNYPLQPKNLTSANTAQATPSTSETKKKSIIHIVKKGETLYDIAQKYKVKVKELKEWNELTTNNYIQAGREMVVYVNETPETPKKQQEQPKNVVSTNTTTSTPTNQKTIKHTVAKNESLSKLANDYNVKMADIKSWNNLKSDNIFVGQQLTIYVPTTFTEKKDNKPASNSTSPTTAVRKENIPIPTLNPFEQNKTYQGNGIIIPNQTKNIGTSNNITLELPKIEVKPTNSVASNNSNNETPTMRGTNPNTNNNTAISDIKTKTNSTNTNNNSTDTNNSTAAQTATESTQLPTIADTPTLVVASSGNTIEKGRAELLEDMQHQRRFIALHRTAPIGTLILVKNPINSNSVVVQVVANLPADTSPNVLIKISKAAWDRLSTSATHLDVELNY